MHATEHEWLHSPRYGMTIEPWCWGNDRGPILHIGLGRFEGGEADGATAFLFLLDGMDEELVLAAPRSKWVDLVTAICSSLGVDEREVMLRGNSSLVLASTADLPPLSSVWSKMDWER